MFDVVWVTLTVKLKPKQTLFTFSNTGRTWREYSLRLKERPWFVQKN